MKTYGRVIVVQLVGALALLGPSAWGQSLFEVDWGSNKINKFIYSNGVLSTNPTLFASGLDEPHGVAFNSAGDLFEADTYSGNINEFINNNGVLSTNPTLFASGLNFPSALAFNSAGDLFATDPGSDGIYEFINNNGVLSTNPTLFAYGLSSAVGLAFNSAGDLFEASETAGEINEFINNHGVLSTNPTLFASGLSGPTALAFDSAGNLFEAEYGSGKIKEFIDNNGVLSTNPTPFASGLTEPYGLAFNSAGDLFESDLGIGKINEFINNHGVLSTNPTLFASGLSGPLGLAFYPIPATMPATQLTVTKLQATVNFNPAKSDIDTCSLTATLGLESSFNVSNQPVTVNVGQAQASFTLNAKGRGVTSADTCKLSYTRKTKLWTLTASMKKGSWATDWAQYGVTNATTAKTGVTVTLPVTVVTSNQTFFTEKTLNYKATADKSGTLK